MDIYDSICEALGLRHIKTDLTFEQVIELYTVPNSGRVTSCYNIEANRINASLGGKARAAKNYPAWNKGKKTSRSKESIEKQRATMTGQKRGPYNYNHAVASTAVSFRGKEYPSISAAVRDTGVSFYTVKRFTMRLPSQLPVPERAT